MLKEQRQGHSCSHGVKKGKVIQETALDGSCASYVLSSLCLLLFKYYIPTKHGFPAPRSTHSVCGEMQVS